MSDLCITVAAYDDLVGAQTDWATIEGAADGWGKGAVVGAVWGLLFPPALLAGAVAGGVGGGVVASLNRSLNRGDLKDLGEAMDAGEIAVVVATNPESVPSLQGMLENAVMSETRVGGEAADVQEALSAGT
jgi:outer membrane lipoprotein SlyB